MRPLRLPSVISSSIDTSNNHDNLKYVFTRSLHLPKLGTETFFLWGPRQTGKTTLLAATYPDALWIDLLKAEEFRRYLQNPELLRAELAARESVRQVVIDEVQKVPQLLDEAHWLHKNRGVHFALCGSSASSPGSGGASAITSGSWSKNVLGNTHFVSPDPPSVEGENLGSLVQSCSFIFPSNLSKA